MKSLSTTIIVFSALSFGGGAAAAQQCVPGTIPVWVAKGSTVEVGCTSVVLSTSQAKLGQGTAAPVAVLIPHFQQKGQAASWTLQPSGDLTSTLGSLNQAITDLQSVKKTDEAAIAALQRQVTALKTALAQTNQAIQQSSQNQGQGDESGAGNENETAQGNNSQYHPPNYQPPSYHPQSGKQSESANALYAPFEVKSKSTGLVLFRVSESAHGGRVSIFDSGGVEVASIGSSASTGNGSMLVHTANGQSEVGVGFNGSIGMLQIDSNGKKLAQLGPGLRAPMGLMIWNSAEAEVVSLEAMPSGDGGLWIGNTKGGTAATIAPNKDGVGIYHGITAVMPVSHP
jgi:hypothetical protein